MCPIDLGIGMDEAKQIGGFEIIPDGTFEFIIRNVISDKPTVGGRPQLRWYLSVINNPQINDKQFLFYNTPLPWVNPQTGQREVEGLNFLVDLVLGVGASWQGTQFDETAMPGKTGFCKVGHRDFQGTPQNTVRIITKK